MRIFTDEISQYCLVKDLLILAYIALLYGSPAILLIAPSKVGISLPLISISAVQFSP